MPFIARSFVRVEMSGVVARSAVDCGEARVSDLISPPWSPKSIRIPGDWISVSITPTRSADHVVAFDVLTESYSSY
jgi:hypothetical protein